MNRGCCTSETVPRGLSAGPVPLLKCIPLLLNMMTHPGGTDASCFRLHPLKTGQAGQ